MPKLLAPEYGGVWSWEGELLPSTILKLSDGREVSLSSLITLTNGDVLEWLEEQEVEKHLAGQHDQSTHGNGNGSADSKSYDIGSYKKTTSSTEALQAVIDKTRFPASDGSGGDYPADGYIDADSLQQWNNFGYQPDTRDAQIIYGSLAEDLTKLVEDRPISVFVREDTLDKILEDGRFKNATEVGGEGSTFKDNNYMATRTVYENAAFGYDNQTPPEQRPITGLVAPAGVTNYEAVDTYGEVQIDLADSVKERSTFTVGDSLNEFLPPIEFRGSVPFTYNYGRIAQETYNSKQAGRKAGVTNPKGPILNSWWHEENYVEAQVHGGVKVSDIAKVTFRGSPPSPSQAAKLDALGIPYEVAEEGGN